MHRQESIKTRFETTYFNGKSNFHSGGVCWMLVLELRFSSFDFWGQVQQKQKLES